MLWAGFLAKALTYSPRLPVSLRPTVTCVAAFVAITVAGPRRISPDFPDAQSVKITKRKLHREKFAVKSFSFSITSL